jgi:hypothetical protein
MENTHVNIYNRPAYASVGLGTIETAASMIAFLLNLAKPLEKSNKGFFIGYAAVNDIIAVGMSYLMAAIFIVFGIVIIRWGIFGLKADKPFLAIIGICQGSLSLLINMFYMILITVQTIRMYNL